MSAAELGTGGIAERINEAHRLAMEHTGAACQYALIVGELLLEAKAEVKATGLPWLPWLRANLTFSERTCQAYMRVARRLPREMRSGAADLSVRGALKILAMPRRLSIKDDIQAWLDSSPAKKDVSQWTIDDARSCIDRVRGFDEIMHRHGLCDGDDDCCLVCGAAA